MVGWVGDADAGAWLVEATRADVGRPAMAELDTKITEAPGVLAGCVWYRSSGTVIAFRDRMGLVPLHLRHEPGTGGLVSTVAAHAWRAGDRAPSPHLGQLARFLCLSNDSGSDDYIKGVERIRPAEIHRFAPGRPQTRRRYWPQPAPPEGAAAAAERFRATFDAAVAAAVSRRPTVVLMSGGLDSSALASTVALQRGATTKNPLDVASMIFPRTPACDESAELDELEHRLPLRIHRFDMDNLWPLRDLSFYSKITDAGPCFHAGTEYEFAFRRLVTERLGPMALMKGIGADQLLEVTRLRLAHSLWRRRHWGALLRAARRDPTRAQVSALLTMVAARMGLSATLDWARSVRRRRSRRSTHWVLESRAPPSDPVPVGGEDQRAEQLFGRGWEHVCRMTREAARFSGGPTLAPLLDHRLWELAFRLPPEVLRLGEQNKGLLRVAMAGRLPEHIRLRPKLKTFDKHVEKGLGLLGAHKVSRLFRRPRLAELGLIDVRAFLSAYEDYCRRVRGSVDSPTQVGSFPIWRTIAAELWLRAVA